MMQEKFFEGKKVLITGGSSGIGLELARQLQALGSQVTLLARDPAKLDAAKTTLLEIRPTDVRLIPVDVSDPNALTCALQDIISGINLPDVLVNSAGFSHPGYVEELPLDVFRSSMETNFLGTVAVTKALLPGFLVRGSGHVVNLSSLAGVIGTFGYSAYGASKFAIRGFSDVLRAEMKPRGIKVSVVFPPDTETPQLHWEAQYKPIETQILAGSDKPLPVSLVARTILEGVAKGRYVIVPGTMAKIQYWLATHTTGLAYWIMDQLVANARKKKSRL